MALLSFLAACTSAPLGPPGGLQGGIDNGQHDGPLVAWGTGGPARYAAPLLAQLDSLRAMECVRFIDGYYRAAANEGYEAVLDYLAGELQGLGFGSADRLQLEWLQADGPVSAWTPLAASLRLHSSSGSDLLLAFAAAADPARTMLPVHAPACELNASFCFDLEQLASGQALVTREPLSDVLEAATERGARAVLSAALAEYNRDPTGRNRQRAALAFTAVPAGTALPVCNISLDVYERLRRAPADARISLSASVKLEARPLRTLVATLVGETRPSEVVVLAAHVQEPGAVDNASGVAGLLEGLRALVQAIEAQSITLPQRSLAFVFGQEMEQSAMYLAHARRKVVAAFSADMIGASRELTGAIPLLERTPDPGALRPLAPDQHTPWGAGNVRPEDLRPNGLALIARTALLDVGLQEAPWRTSEHPWEGGSDHDVFLEAGIPAVLLWCFTDFAYHTSLDRLEHVDPEVLARMTAALLSAALASADPWPTDLERYLRSLDFERRLRLYSARQVGDLELEARWEEWCLGARTWLRQLCLGFPMEAQGSAQSSAAEQP